MTDLELVLAFWITHVAVLLIPGTNVLLVLAYGLAGSRRDASLCALGVATGTVVWCALASQGLSLFLKRLPGAEPVVAVAAAVYLFYVGWHLLRSSRRVQQGATVAPGTSYFTGLAASVTNLKSGVFFASAFAAVPTLRSDMVPTLVVVAILNSAFWHLSLAIFFSAFSIVLTPVYVRRMKVISGTVVCLIALASLARVV